MEEKKGKGKQKFAAADVILEALIDGVGIVDINANIIQSNNALVKMLGFKSLKDVLGESIVNFIAEKDISKTMEEFKKCITTGTTMNVEFGMKREDGTSFPCMFNATVLKDEKKEIVGLVANLRDITELKRLQEKEKEAAAQKRSAVFDDIIELNPYSIQICDAEGHHIRANKVFEKLFGTTPPPEWSLFNDPILKEKCPELLEKLKKGESIKIPVIWYNAHDVDPRAPDNPICLGATHFSIFDDKDNLKIIVNIHEDITKLKRAEEELKAKIQKLEKFHNLTVGRELRMVELKNEIKELKKKLEAKEA